MSQLHFLSTATLPIYQLVIKVVLPGYTGVISCGSTITQSRNISIAYLIRWLHKVLSNSYFFEQVAFSEPLIFKGSYFFNAAFFLSRKYTFLVNTISKQLLFTTKHGGSKKKEKQMPKTTVIRKLAFSTRES